MASLEWGIPGQAACIYSFRRSLSRSGHSILCYRFYIFGFSILGFVNNSVTVVLIVRFELLYPRISTLLYIKSEAYLVTTLICMIHGKLVYPGISYLNIICTHLI